MRFFILSVTLLVGLCSCAVNKKAIPNYPDNLIKETKDAMAALGIYIRPNILQDSPIMFQSDTALSEFNAHFHNDRGLYPDANNPAHRYYLNPSIKISPALNSVVSRNKDTTAVAHIKALSLIIHELAHYMQVTDNKRYFNPKTYEEEKAYISQQIEFEAHSVQSYYFLSHYNKDGLKKIMELKVTPNRKMELLINAFRRLAYPWRAQIFAEQ